MHPLSVEMSAEYNVVSDVSFKRDERQLCRRITVTFCESPQKPFTAMDFETSLYAIVASKMRDDSAKGHIHCAVEMLNKASGERLFRLPHVNYWLVRAHHFAATGFRGQRRFQSRCFLDSFEIRMGTAPVDLTKVAYQSLDYFKLMDNTRDEKPAAYDVLLTTVLKPVCHQGTFVSYETQFALTKRAHGRSRTDQLEDAVRDITEKTLTYSDNDVVKVTLEVDKRPL